MDQWWGYLHISGTIHVKRYLGPLDIEEAEESDFCQRVYGPFDAIDRDDAFQKINTELGIS